MSLFWIKPCCKLFDIHLCEPVWHHLSPAFQPSMFFPSHFPFFLSFMFLNFTLSCLFYHPCLSGSLLHPDQSLMAVEAALSQVRQSLRYQSRMKRSWALMTMNRRTPTTTAGVRSLLLFKMKCVFVCGGVLFFFLFFMNLKKRKGTQPSRQTKVSQEKTVSQLTHPQKYLQHLSKTGCRLLMLQSHHYTGAKTKFQCCPV